MAQYVSAPRVTEVERKLKEIEDCSKDTLKNVIDNFSKKRGDSDSQLLDLNLQPNNYFISEHKKRKEKEEQLKSLNKNALELDENGYKLENIYYNNSYKRLHDPLNLYASTNNYKSLSWKVYTDVNDSDVFLKTLYYPNLRSDDYNSLISKFTDVYRYNTIFKKMGIVFGGVSAALFYNASVKKFTFTGKTTIVLSGVIGYTVYCIMTMQLSLIIKKTLNNYARHSIAENYPELKITKVEYLKEYNH